MRSCSEQRPDHPADPRTEPHPSVRTPDRTTSTPAEALRLFCSQLLTPPRLRVAGVNVGARCPEGASRDGRPGSELASRARLETLSVL